MRWSLAALLRVGGSDKTCHQEIITYKGSQSGPAYLRIRSDDRSSYFGINDNVSMESLSTSMPHSDVCWSGGPHIDIPVTATAWIDVSGTESAACADPHDNSQCQPAPSDPQGRQRAVLQFGQVNEIHIDVVDPQ